jgi:DNA-binding PadR family transcriptional regulator
MRRIRILQLIKEGYDDWSGVKLMLDYAGYKSSDSTLWEDFCRLEREGLIKQSYESLGIRHYQLTEEGERALKAAHYLVKSRRGPVK